MPDNVDVNPSSSYTVAADVSGTVAYQRVKLVVGEDGTFGPDVGTTTPLPVSGSVGVSGSVTVVGAPAVSGSVTVIGALPAVSGTVTVAGTVTALGVSGTVTVAGTVTALGVSGTVSVSNIDGQALYTTAAPAASSTALIVILKSNAPVVVSGTVSISNPTSGTITVSNTVGVSGTVTVNPGLSVSAVVSGTVTVAAGLSVSAVVSGTVTVAGTVTALGVSGTVTAIAASGSVSIINTATFLPAQSTTAMPSTSATGQIVWIAGGSLTQSVTVSATAVDVARTQICIIVTSTLLVSGTTCLVTVYQSMSQTIAGATSWVVPAGKTFRVLSVGLGVNNSITTTPCIARINVLASSAAPTWTSTAPIVARLAVGALTNSLPGVGVMPGLVQDVGAGVTVAIAITVTTATTNIIEGVIMGYLYP